MHVRDERERELERERERVGYIPLALLERQFSFLKASDRFALLYRKQGEQTSKQVICQLYTCV